mgnify:CR=1 FL=1
MQGIILVCCWVALAFRLCGIPQDCTAVLTQLLFGTLCRHGDLKAGNVLLTVNPSPGNGDGCPDHSEKCVEVWTAAGSQPLSAKVADFGMAMPLGPKDTHATMLARGVSYFAPLFLRLVSMQACGL